MQDMIIGVDFRGDLPQLGPVSDSRSLYQAAEAAAAGRAATKFSQEMRDLFAIICNNLERLRDEFDADDPRRPLVVCTLRLAQASAALAPECERPHVRAFSGTRQPQFDSPQRMGRVDATLADSRHAAGNIHRVSSNSLLDLSAFTPRQLSVLHLLAEGLPTKEIARRLGLGPGTVKIHLAGIYRVINSRSRLEAVIKARELVVECSSAKGQAPSSRPSMIHGEA